MNEIVFVFHLQKVVSICSIHVLHPARELQVRQNPPDFLNRACLHLALQLLAIQKVPLGQTMYTFASLIVKQRSIQRLCTIFSDIPSSNVMQELSWSIGKQLAHPCCSTCQLGESAYRQGHP